MCIRDRFYTAKEPAAYANMEDQTWEEWYNARMQRLRDKKNKKGKGNFENVIESTVLSKVEDAVQDVVENALQDVVEDVLQDIVEDALQDARSSIHNSIAANEGNEKVPDTNGTADEETGEILD